MQIGRKGWAMENMSKVSLGRVGEEEPGGWGGGNLAREGVGPGRIINYRTDP